MVKKLEINSTCEKLKLKHTQIHICIIRAWVIYLKTRFVMKAEFLYNLVCMR